MKAPIIDVRDVNMLVKKMEEMVPYYTPEWRFSAGDGDPGAALFMSFADMFGGLIKRFNMVPEKNFIAFLNMLDIKLLPAQPAAAPVSFDLSVGTTQPVLVPSGTQIAADVSGGDGPVVFETVNNMLATPAMPRSAYNVSVKHDTVTRVPAEFFAGPAEPRPEICLFDLKSEPNLQEHIIYIAHENIFNLTNPAAIIVEFRNLQKTYREAEILAALANPEYVRWQYWAEVDGLLGWHDFDQISLQANSITMIKARPGLLELTDINGSLNRWIRGIGQGAFISTLTEVEVDRIRLHVDFDLANDVAGIAPDMLFYNDLPLDLHDFHPFGEFFILYDNFYISSQEVFSKKGAMITVDFSFLLRELELQTGMEGEVQWKLIMKKADFEKKEPLKKCISRVNWEYWNGTGWLKLTADVAAEEAFLGQEGKRTVTFKCPEDMDQAWVNNQLNYWIRLRVTRIENMYAASLFYLTPLIDSVSLKYQYAQNCPVDVCQALNDMEYRDLSKLSRENSRTFYPFVAQDKDLPMFYLGFDRPPVSGPISIFFPVTEQVVKDSSPARLEWEYLRERNGVLEWAGLKLADQTNHLTNSGIVSFVGPADFAHRNLFGDQPYWLRIVNADGKLEDPASGLPVPRIKGMCMNTTWAVQQEEKGTTENLGPAEGQPHKEYMLAKAPILKEEVWVNEQQNLTDAEKNAITAAGKSKIEVIRDDFGRILEFWVQWQAVEDMYESTAHDRHYVIDRAMGRLRFGDGVHGKIPPFFKGAGIKVTYKTGGGTKGNVGSFTICKLLNPVAFVKEVFNPVPATGGCDMETIEKATLRGPQLIKHRNRAVAAQDFENLTRQSSQSIAKVKCLPNFNAHGHKENGWVTVVILPAAAEGFARPTSELKEKVHRYLAERTMNNLAFSQRLQVIEPLYLEISLHGVLIANDMNVVPLVEKESLAKLNSFLDPHRGGYEGAGWAIGQQPHISMFYSLLKTVTGVNFVEKASMTVCTIIDGRSNEVDPASLVGVPHVLVVNGKHKIDVTI